MNRFYKSIWNERTRTFVAVAENARSRGKRSASTRKAASALLGAAAVGLAGAALADVTIGDSTTPVQTDGNSIQFSGAAGAIDFQNGGTISGLTASTLASGGTNAATTGQLWQTNQDLLQTSQDLTNVTATVTGLDTTVGNHTAQLSSLSTTVGAHASEISSLQTASAASVRYDDAAGKSLITLEGTAGTRITNLADGTIAAGSKDAVTGGQMYTLEQKLYSQGEGVKYFHANSSLADSAAVGSQSVAIGPETESSGVASFAAGQGAATTDTAEGAIALGQGAMAGTEDGAVADGAGSIAIGRDSQASGNSTVALGDGASVEDERVSNALAIGTDARVSGNQSDQAVAIGNEAHAGAASATALGAAAAASGTSATALGAGAQASGGSSIAIGQSNAAAGSAFAAGTGAYAGTPDSIALGTNAGVGTVGNAAGDRTSHIAIGTGAGQTVAGNQNTAIGYSAGSGVTGDDNIALGTEAGGGLTGNNNISIGVGANNGAGGRAQAISIGARTEAGSDSVALGDGARALGTETLALGKDSGAEGNGVAVGALAWADGNSVALGRNSAARNSDISGSGYLTGAAAPGSVVSVGNTSSDLQRRIVNVADGAQGYDAVNVRQLQGAQQSVATLIGGGVTVNSDGSFSPITVQDVSGNDQHFNTVVDAIGAVTSGQVDILPVDAVRYNTEHGISNVAAGVNATDAVNVQQLNEAVAENGVKYFSANTSIPANRLNDGATGANAMAIGPAAVAGGDAALAIGDAARVNDGATAGVAIGSDVSARAANATTLGNSSHTYDQGGVAIGQQAVSRGQNSIVMGTGAEADPKSGGTVDNAIVIGTVAEATADDGVAIGQSALASEVRAVAQGYDAHATADDAMAFGTRSRASGVSSQASGTDAQASGENAQASGTNASASGGNAIASGTDSRGYATDGIALGTGAVSGLLSPLPEEAARNSKAIAIGDHSLADYENALALGVEANARAESATAVGDGAQATGIDSLAVGSGARATALNASAFGQGAQALNEGSVALGSGAVTAAPVGTSSATIDKITYNYAGTSPVATVSVGSVGNERSITNVAAGRVSASSTDAINGSQLFQTNAAVTALGNNLDTAGQSVAAALGGTSSYNPSTHTVTAGLSVRGNSYTNVQNALTYVAQGWNVSADGGAAANVAPGGSVDFGNTDDNIVIARNGTNLSFNLSDDVEVGNSITVGDTVVNGDSVTANNLTVGGETRLGDNFVVNNAGNVTYNGSEVATQADGLSFAGNTGGAIAKTLGDTTPLTVSGALAAGEASTGANLRVDSDGSKLNLVMARNLTDLDSITINNGGPVINGSGIDMGGKKITNLAAGTADTDAVNVSQLNDVADVANAGWNLSANGAGSTQANIGPDGDVVFNGDSNITVTQTGVDDDGAINVALNKDIDLGSTGSIKTGNSQMDNSGLNVTDGSLSTQVGAGGITVGNGTNTIVINGGSGDITGLSNRDLDAADFATQGRAATEEQLKLVQEGTSELNDRAVKYDLNPDNTVNYNVVTMQGTPGTATRDPATGNITTTGGTQITNVASAGDYTDVDNALNAVNAGDLNNAVQNVTSAGLNFSANAGADVHRNLGQTLAIRGGMADTTPASETSGQNVITRTTADGIDIELAKDAVFDSVTTGDTVMDTDGVRVGTDVALTDEGLRVDSADPDTYTDLKAGSFTVAGGGNTIVINGSSGTISGLTNQTINYPGFADGSGRAATEEQLGQVKGGVDDLADRAVKYDGNVGDPKNKITLEGDVSTDGGRTGGTQITNVARGDISENSTDAVNGSQIHEMGQSIADGMGGNSQFVDGKLVTELDVGGNTYNNVNDALNGVQTNIDEVAEVANAGWQIQANGDQASKVAPGKTVEFVDGDNIQITRQTSADGNNQVKVSMAKDIKVDSVTANTVNAKEVAIEDGPTINQDGIDMNDKRITNLADGVGDKDAVNVGQLSKATSNITNQINRLDGRVNRVENRANAGIAAALATAALPQAYLPGKSMFSLGGGTWNGETGYAMGLSTVSDNGKWVVKGSATSSSRGDYGAAVGVGYQW